MKHIIICIIASAYFFAGCNNNTPKDVDHEHQQNEVDTDHEHEQIKFFARDKKRLWPYFKNIQRACFGKAGPLAFWERM